MDEERPVTITPPPDLRTTKATTEVVLDLGRRGLGREGRVALTPDEAQEAIFFEGVRTLLLRPDSADQPITGREKEAIADTYRLVKERRDEGQTDDKIVKSLQSRLLYLSGLFLDYQPEEDVDRQAEILLDVLKLSDQVAEQLVDRAEGLRREGIIRPATDTELAQPGLTDTLLVCRTDGRRYFIDQTKIKVEDPPSRPLSSLPELPSQVATLADLFLPPIWKEKDPADYENKRQAFLRGLMASMIRPEINLIDRQEASHLAVDYYLFFRNRSFQTPNVGRYAMMVKDSWLLENAFRLLGRSQEGDELRYLHEPEVALIPKKEAPSKMIFPDLDASSCAKTLGWIDKLIEYHRKQEETQRHFDDAARRATGGTLR